MKLAGHTYAFRHLPLAGALEQLSELGLSDVELWLGHADDVDETVSTVLRAGVNVRALSAGGYYDATDDTPRRAFELASALGVDLVVMCVAPRLVPHVVEIASAGVRVAVENHWDQPLCGSEEVSRAIGATNLLACLDTGHALTAGERPEHFAQALGSSLAHVHLKEGRLPSLWERAIGRRIRRRLLGRAKPLWPGHGDLDIPRLRSALVSIPLDGWVTVEHEGDRPSEALRRLIESWGAPP